MEHSAFMPHGICYLWKPELVFLHVISDVVTALAYYAIPPALGYLVIRARREAKSLGTPSPARGLPYEWVYLAFGLFIIACGTTHLMGVVTVWTPAYWLSGSIKAVTALASVATAIALPPLVPKALALFREARISELQHAQLSQLAAIVEYSDDAIITKDLTGRVLTWNAGATRLYGYTAEEMVGESLDKLLPEDRPDELRHLLDRIVLGESVPHLDTVRRRRDGSLVEISLTISPIRNAEGRVIAASAIGRDSSAQKRMHERELALVQEQGARAEAERMAEHMAALAAEQTRLYEEANAVSRTKSEFLGVMSHELRTPLNAIVGYADLLEAGISGELTEVQREQVRRIRRSGNHLRDLIEQVLVHARLEAGKAEPRWSQVELRQLAREALQLVEPDAARKGLELECEVPADLRLETDPVYLRQILLNLLSNGVKFTERGTVNLTATRADGTIEITIRDTGRGIAEADLGRIFDPFWQAEQGRTRSAEGTGLGLSVAQRLADVLGGSLHASSQPGAGTAVTLRLPVARS